MAVAGTLLGVPVSARAQQTPPRTHTVSPGETLWRIATDALGDGHRWREILELNRDVVSDPRRLPSGSTLRLPPAASGTDATDAPGRNAQAPGAAAASGARDVEPVDSLADAAPDTQGRTVFTPVEPPAGSVSSLARRPMSPPPTVRAGEFFAAPYAAPAGGPVGAGRIVATTAEDRNPAFGIARNVQMYERVVIQPPVGSRPAAGDRLLAWRPGPLLSGGGGGGQVVIPTGIVTVESASAGAPTIGRVTSTFETMDVGVALSALASPPPADLAAPRPVTGGREGRVLWVEASPALASLQTYLVLDLGEGDGLRAGDQVVLVRSAPGDATGPGTDVRIATASVVRVTREGASAIVIAQREPAITVGTRVRVSAAVP